MDCITDPGTGTYRSDLETSGATQQRSGFRALSCLGDTPRQALHTLSWCPSLSGHHCYVDTLNRAGYRAQRAVGAPDTQHMWHDIWTSPLIGSSLMRPNIVGTWVRQQKSEKARKLDVVENRLFVLSLSTELQETDEVNFECWQIHCGWSRRSPFV